MKSSYNSHWGNVQWQKSHYLPAAANVNQTKCILATVEDFIIVSVEQMEANLDIEH